MHPTLGEGSGKGRLVEPCHIKVNSRCFWNACKALSFGLLLMLLGATMATLGYYADQLSMGQELRGNLTVRVKHETTAVHLNNLSYAGPIVMGFGGFIVVAACVMTFEARDSAAKVVPSRGKYSSCQRKPGSTRVHSVRSEAARAGSIRASPDRRALTQAFLHFSRRLETERCGGEPLTKSPSAPDLQTSSPPAAVLAPRRPSPRTQRSSRSSLHPVTAFLSPHALLHRQALSVDNPDYMGYFPVATCPDGHDLEPDPEMHTARGSQASMVMDIHVVGEGAPTSVRVKDKRRSDLSRRHHLTRQSQVVEEEWVESTGLRRLAASVSPRLPSYHGGRSPHDYDPRPRSTPHSRRQSIAHSKWRGGSSEECGTRREGSPSRRASSASCSRSASVRRASGEVPRHSECRRASSDSRRADSRRASSDSRHAASDSRRASSDSRRGRESRRSSADSRRSPRRGLSPDEARAPTATPPPR